MQLVVALFGDDACVLDDFGPALILGFDERAEIFRRFADHDFHAAVAKPFFHGGVFHQLHDDRIELFDAVARRALRHEVPPGDRHGNGVREIDEPGNGGR